MALYLGVTGKYFVHAGKQFEPELNETLYFSISNSASELILKIMDGDAFMDDYAVGEATWATLHRKVLAFSLSNLFCF